MLLQLLIYFALAAATTTLAVFIPRAVRARMWIGLPLGLIAMAAATGLYSLLTGQADLARILGVAALVLALLTRIVFRRWSWLGAQLMVLLTLASLSYIGFAVTITIVQQLSPMGLVGSILLLLIEVIALALSISYAFEIVDVLSRRPRPLPEAPHYWPRVALQVPTYNEPVEVVQGTLESLARLDYPNFIVQVVDNNTKDPAVWQPLEVLCRHLGPRFQFMHLEPWPGFKAGALNEATRRLPPDIEVVGIVDADYVIRPGFLKAVVGHFQDPEVAFVQTPQDYRDWQDDDYLRGLFYSYRYFFDITMPARAHRNGIIFAGTMGLIRRRVLEEAGGWNTRCITEDAEASLRILGHGYHGVFEPEAWGSGLMPLSFDGLKKQRFRWALGGIQILRLHWREMLGWPGAKLKLTFAQRIHYLLGSVQWFSELLTASFTILLLGTAIATAMHHQLPVRRVTGSALVIPFLFLVTGLLRAVWAMRIATACTWGDALRALRVWFALSWVVTLACLRGLMGAETAFLRTPKRAEESSWLHALRSSRGETILMVSAWIAAVAMVVRAPYPPVIALALLLALQGWIYSNALWASLSADGIKLTPMRRAYLRSAQNTGDRPGGLGRMAAVPLAAAAGVVAALAAMLLLNPSNGQAPFTGPAGPQPAVAATPTPAPTPPPTPRPTERPTLPTLPTVPTPKLPSGLPTIPGQPTPRSTATPTPGH